MWALLSPAGWAETEPAPAVPTIEMIRSALLAREEILSDRFEASYTVDCKPLPGKRAWYAEEVRRQEIPAYVMDDRRDGELEWSQSCTLKMLGQCFQFAGDDQLDPQHLYTLQWCSDGNITWYYQPKQACVTIREDTVHSADLREYVPDLRVFLTRYPTYTSGLLVGGDTPKLSELLWPSAGYPIHLRSLPDGKVLLELTTHVTRGLPWHVMKRKVTLDPARGFAPVEYSLYVQCGQEVFPPDLTARYDDFAEVDGVQVPRKVDFVTTSSLRIHGKNGDALKVADFQTYEFEKLTIKIQDLKLKQTFDAKDFACNPPPGTKMSREEKPAHHFVLKTGLVSFGFMLAYFGIVFLRRQAG